MKQSNERFEAMLGMSRRLLGPAIAVALGTIVAVGSIAASGQAPERVNDAGQADEQEEDEEGSELPWDYSPYRVLIWVVSDDPDLNAATLEEPLRDHLNLDFAALWRLEIKDAPTAVASAAMRNLSGLTYDAISASDPILAVKRDHREAVRIRIPANVGEFVGKIYATPARIAEVKRQAAKAGDESIAGVAKRLVAVEGDEIAVRNLWADPSTEAVLVSRGMALTLDDPEAKLIVPPISDLVTEAVDAFDKIFVVRIERDTIPNRVSATEMETLMRHFGPVTSEHSLGNVAALAATVGRVVTRAFAPVVRIEEAGQTNAEGLLRGGGLIVNERSPANVRVSDVLEPMIRKDDRNGNPISIGAIDWAFLHVTEPEIAVVRAKSGSGFTVADQVIRVAGRKIQLPQEIEYAWEQHRGESVEVEVRRQEKEANVEIEAVDPNAPPLALMYLGFTAGERRGQVIVRSIIEGGPADGKLQVGDAIVAVAESKISSIGQLSRLVVAEDSEQPLVLSVGRQDQGVIEVSVDPSGMSARQRQGGTKLYMEYYAGRAGGLQGRQNKRTFRIALKVRPFDDETMIRLHAKGDEGFPLIGYEIYQKELTSSDMSFVGRTDWNGRLSVGKTDDPLRLFYVKNGGAVLARLPVVPGLTQREVADISGDDMRLQAEAYIRGVQNSIIDLVAVRELFKARIQLRLKKGTPEDTKKAKDLVVALRSTPTNEKLATDMGRKQDMFIKAIGRNAAQRRKVDEMFKITRDLLAKHINPKMIDELEAQVAAAERNGGRPPQPASSEERGSAAPAEERAREQPAA